MTSPTPPSGPLVPSSASAAIAGPAGRQSREVCDTGPPTLNDTPERSGFAVSAGPGALSPQRGNAGSGEPRSSQIAFTHVGYKVDVATASARARDLCASTTSWTAAVSQALLELLIDSLGQTAIKPRAEPYQDRLRRALPRLSLRREETAGTSRLPLAVGLASTLRLPACRAGHRRWTIGGATAVQNVVRRHQLTPDRESREAARRSESTARAVVLGGRE